MLERFKCVGVKVKINYQILEKFSQEQQYIVQLYNCHWMLIISRHVSTYLPSHLKALLSVRLCTVKSNTIARLRSQRLTNLWFPIRQNA
jgi:hypothetical protein